MDYAFPSDFKNHQSCTATMVLESTAYERHTVACIISVPFYRRTSFLPTDVAAGVACIYTSRPTEALSHPYASVVRSG